MRHALCKVAATDAVRKAAKLADDEYGKWTTWNGEYGVFWEKCKHLRPTVLPIKDQYRVRGVRPDQLPIRCPGALDYVTYLKNPCSSIGMANPALDRYGRFANLRRDLFYDRKGLWANWMFNNPESDFKHRRGTFSNLQGAWGRVGDSTFEALRHNNDPAVRYDPYPAAKSGPVKTVFSQKFTNVRDEGREHHDPPLDMEHLPY